jgi:Zn-dependent protease
MGNITALGLRFGVYLAIGLLVGMIGREYARAWIAARLGDPTPRLWGRLTLSPKAWFEPFGSGLLPGLILILWIVQASLLPPPFAYAKPAPVDPGYLKRGSRDVVIVSIAGPLVNVVLALVGSLPLRLGLSGEAALVPTAFVFANLSLAVFHLLPIPGLDGARLVALLLPPEAREAYRNLDRYLPLFIIVVVFLLAHPVYSIVYGLVGALCRTVGGSGCPLL